MSVKHLIYCRLYEARPKKLQRSLEFVGLGHSQTAEILLESGSIPLVENT